MEPFKNIYNQEFFERFTVVLNKIDSSFNSAVFFNEIFDEQWEQLELKQRMRRITIVLNQLLDRSFKEVATIIQELIPQLLSNGFKADNLEFMFLADIVEVYGIEEYETSVEVFEKLTQFVSCEFAVRPFILKYPEKMIDQMYKWSNHSHSSVRRLATEGCRPRLPWAMAIPFLKENPSAILPILENLKSDESETVRRSVANNLNDIAKDNPSAVVDIAKRWKGISKETDWLVKHSCRTLLKQGNQELMQLFGFGEIDKIKISDFTILTSEVSIGDALEFQFNLENTNNSEALIRLEYGLYYQKANQSLSKKVFKISEKKYDANSSTLIRRKQSFKIITTRKFHVGLHQVSIILNGVELEKKDFELINTHNLSVQN